MTTLNHARPPTPSGVQPTSLPPAHHRGMNRVARVLVAGDAVWLGLAVAVAWLLRLRLDLGLPRAEHGESVAWSTGPAIVVTWLVLLRGTGAYARRNLGAGTEEYRAVLIASASTAGLVGVSCYLTAFELSRGFLALAFIIGTLLLLTWRYAARLRVHRLRKRGDLVHRVVAVGGADDIAEICQVLRRERHLGYEVVGACTRRPVTTWDDSVVPVVGTSSTVLEACRTVGADTVLVAGGGYESSSDLREIAWALQGSQVQMVVSPSLTEVAGPRIDMRPVAGLPLIHLEEPQADEAGGLAKRVFDVVGSFVAIALLAPVMVVVAIAIKLEDGGRILFRQHRVGWHGDLFPCFKFRSMVRDADQLEAGLRAADGHAGALWKRQRDPRITRVGRFIRKYSLDELPQLFNVLTGQMSLVGPRPQQSWEVETYSDATRRRLLVRPGMTGLWQVSGRSALPLEEAVRLDLYYVDNWSLATDLVIMAKTAKAVLTSSGAY